MVGVLIRNRLGIDVFGTNTRIEGVDLGRVRGRRNVRSRVHVRLPSDPPRLYTDRCHAISGRLQPGLAGRRDFVFGGGCARCGGVGEFQNQSELAADSSMIYGVVLGRGGRDVVRRDAGEDVLGVTTRSDFLVAGRKLPWPVLVFTLLSSWIGAGSLFAGAENAYLQRLRRAVAAGGRMGGADGHRGRSPGGRGDSRSSRCPDLARNALQRHRARAGHHRDRHLLYRDHQLSIQRRRRHSAPDFSRARSDHRHVYHRGVRDRVHGGGGHGVGRLSGPGDRLAGDGRLS